jgi:hypothetical protein
MHGETSKSMLSHSTYGITKDIPLDRLNWRLRRTALDAHGDVLNRLVGAVTGKITRRSHFLRSPKGPIR